MTTRVATNIQSESLKLVGIQAGCGWALLVAMNAMGYALRVPVVPEFAVLGILVGSALYGHFREKRYPFTLSDHVHPLSLRVAFIQLLIALGLLGLYALSKGWITIPMERVPRERLFVFTMIVLGSALPITYLLTRVGMAMSIRRLMQERASG